jgi:hypothetical protein
MTCTFPIIQEQRPANLTALQQWLQEVAAKAKPSKERPVILQEPVLVVKGK